MTKLTINTDGGARGNPGPAAIGIVLRSHEKNPNFEASDTITIGTYIGETTNNVAEYTALVKALEKARELKADEIECFLDSELVVKQLNGSYKVKDKNMKNLWVMVKNLEAKFKKVTFSHIPRSQNKEADKIVNEVLDSTLISGGGILPATADPSPKSLF